MMVGNVTEAMALIEQIGKKDSCTERIGTLAFMR